MQNSYSTTRHGFTLMGPQLNSKTMLNITVKPYQYRYQTFFFTNPCSPIKLYNKMPLAGNIRLRIENWEDL